MLRNESMNLRIHMYVVLKPNEKQWKHGVWAALNALCWTTQNDDFYKSEWL